MPIDPCAPGCPAELQSGDVGWGGGGFKVPPCRCVQTSPVRSVTGSASGFLKTISILKKSLKKLMTYKCVLIALIGY